MTQKPPLTQAGSKTGSMVSAAVDLGGVIASPENTLTKRLAERRIDPETIQTFDIQPRGNGWQYPTPGGGLRWKNADSTAPNKYAWLDGKSEPATALYYAPDLPGAINQAGGACWLAGGEPDVWALRSAGVYHALSGFTEAAAPKGLAEYLQSLGVTDLYIAPDLDLTGERWAGKIAAALEASGIDLVCRELPAELGKGGDIGKAWQHYAKRKPFERELLDMPRWYPAPEVVKKKNQIELLPTSKTGGAWDLDPLTRQAIYDKLGVRGFRNHWSINHVLCPFHDDHKPSANVNENWGLYCHTCQQSYNWKALAGALGVDFVSFTQAPAGYIVSTTNTAGIRGLSIETQAALIKLGFTALARVLDLLYAMGYQGGEVMTVKELQAACSDLPTYTTRAAIDQGTGKATPKKRVIEGIFPLLFFTPYEVEKSLKNPQGGRPKNTYRLPTQAEVNQALNIKPKTYQALRSDVLANAKAYKAEICAAPIRRKPGDYARVQLAKPLGIHPKTTAAYMKAADIETTPNIRWEILTDADILAMPQDGHELSDLRRQGKIKGAAWLEAVKESKASLRFAPCKESAILAREFAGPGGKVYKVTQYANTYTPKVSK